MPRHKAVWSGTRLVRAETVITAATVQAARAIAEQLDLTRLHFRVVDDTHDQIADMALHSLGTVADEEERAPQEEQVDRAEGEGWWASL